MNNGTFKLELQFYRFFLRAFWFTKVDSGGRQPNGKDKFMDKMDKNGQFFVLSIRQSFHWEIGRR
jgi:hypothetical protein